MFNTMTICNSCGKLVHTAPGVCLICGSATQPNVLFVPVSLPVFPSTHLPRTGGGMREAHTESSEGREYRLSSGRENRLSDGQVNMAIPPLSTPDQMVWSNNGEVYKSIGLTIDRFATLAA